MDSHIELLREAIKTAKQVTGFCNNLPREFCPHILGTKGDHWNVLVWQFGGETSRPERLPQEGDWRCYELRDLDRLELRDGEWHRGWYTGRGEQHCVDDIDTVVDANRAAVLRRT